MGRGPANGSNYMDVKLVKLRPMSVAIPNSVGFDQVATLAYDELSRMVGDYNRVYNHGGDTYEGNNTCLDMPNSAGVGEVACRAYGDIARRYPDTNRVYNRKNIVYDCVDAPNSTGVDAIVCSGFNGYTYAECCEQCVGCIVCE